MILKARNIRYLFLILGIILAMPLPFPLLSGGMIWISPYMVLNSVLAVKNIVILHLFGLLTLIIIFYKNHWICRYTCPLGVVCDWSSKFRKNKDTARFNLNKFLAITSIVLAVFGAPVFIVFDPFNIFHMSFESFRTGIHFSALFKASYLLFIVFLNIIFPNIWCRSICPLGGMQILAFDLGKVTRKSAAPRKISANKRRFFIASLTGVIAGITLPRLSYFASGKNIRPPAALSMPDINLVCARCGNCSSVCPTNIIKQSDDTSKVGSLLTPVIDFSESYCLPECTLCGDVCPSGAISRFTKKEKKDLFMASVRIETDECWLQNQRDCDLCRFHCAYDAIEIKKIEENPIALPVLNENKCVGCAACKIICPAEAIEMK